MLQDGGSIVMIYMPCRAKLHIVIGLKYISINSGHPLVFLSPQVRSLANHKEIHLVVTSETSY